MKNNSPPSFATLAIHAGESRDPQTDGYSAPIYQTAAFAFDSGEALSAAIAQPLDSFFYSRTANPTTNALERKLAALEGSEAALVTASGMAAVAIVVMISVQAGDHILVSEDLFVISRQFFMEDCPAMGIEVSFVDIRDLAAVRAALQPNSKAIFVETISNPHIHIADLPALRQMANEQDLTLIVDNTFGSPYLLRPTEFGADLTLHSATKYISGHGDTVAGVIAGSKRDMDKARLKLDSFGGCLSPMNAWLVLRGARTLPLRMKQHSQNGLALAAFLDAHPKVEWVGYPGLPSHPQHSLCQSLFANGFGGMMAFKVKGDAAEMNRFVNAVQMCDIAVSLGDLHTLVYPKPTQNNLIRVSVGCEEAEDIIADFAQALDKI